MATGVQEHDGTELVMPMSSLGRVLLASIATTVAVHAGSTQLPSMHTMMLQGATPSTAEESPCVPSRDASVREFRVSPVTRDHELDARNSPNEAAIPVSAGRRVTIVGGLRPTANVAAQAGALDWTQSVIAATDGTAGRWAAEQQELRVQPVRPPSDSCRSQ